MRKATILVQIPESKPKRIELEYNSISYKESDVLVFIKRDRHNSEKIVGIFPKIYTIVEIPFEEDENNNL